MKYTKYFYIGFLYFAFMAKSYSVEITYCIYNPHSSSKVYFFSNDSFNLINYATKSEQAEHLFQQLKPASNKLLFNILLKNTCSKLFRNSNIAYLILKSKNDIIRLEGKDLISPFKYFW